MSRGPGWRSFGIAALCGGLLVAVAGCLEAPREPLRVGVNAWPPFELLYLAREKGFFRDEGVEVDLIDFSSYTGILRSYHQGNLDAFFATLNEILIAENFQDLPAVVLVADYSYGGDALVVRGGLESLGQLRGKKIAFEESALGSYVLERILELGGLRTDEVVAINRLPEEGEQDFQRGAVDAVITYEPGLGRLLRGEPGARAIFTSRDIPGEIVDVLVLRRAALHERAADARRMMKAWFRALAYLKENPHQASEVMAKRQRVTVAEFLGGLRGAHIPDLEENRRLMGSSGTPGPLHQTAARLGEFLVRRGLARKTASGAELLHHALIESL